MGRKHQVLPGVGIYRDTPGGQRLHIGRELGARRQQDAAVLVPHRAGGTALPYRLSSVHQLRDALGDPTCIGLGLIVRQKQVADGSSVFVKSDPSAGETLPLSACAVNGTYRTFLR